MKFKKKPVVIDAVLLSQDSVEEVLEFMGVKGKSFAECGHGIDPACGAFTITTLEGPLRASLGDWVIRGVKGEYYACKPDIFEQTYEPVLEDPLDR